MDTPEITLTLIPALNEPPDPQRLVQLQEELDRRLRQLTELNSEPPDEEISGSSIEVFDGGLIAAASRAITSFFSAVATLRPTLETTLATLGPTLGTALGAWLHARYGRKVRVKIGEIEVEAQTLDEVQKLIAQAEEIQQRNAPKIIQEP